MELGSVTLKRIGFFFVFQLNTQHTHNSLKRDWTHEFPKLRTPDQ